MGVWEDVFKTPFGSHWTFKNIEFAKLPVGSRIFPVFLRKGFSPNESVRCEIPTQSDTEWVVAATLAFKPSDILFDTQFKEWNKKPVSAMVELDNLMLVRLETPVENPLQGRSFVAFLLFVEELQPF